MNEAAKAARLGIFGGTFNPIHLGHLRAAEEACEELGLERLLFLPSAVPPHKAPRDEPIAPAEVRLEWVRLATAGNPRFEVDPMEIERDGPSYSIDSLRSIRSRGAPEPPVFVLGQDAFSEMDTWREPESLFQLAHFAVLTRPPVLEGSLEQWLPSCVRGEIELAANGCFGWHRSARTWIRLVVITALAISATDVRERVREGRSVRYLVPEAVREAILESGVYGAKEAS
jgi:nicotinate-nucleotide adenylyltransferase